MATVRVIHFSTLDVKSQHFKNTFIAPFFSLFEGSKLKYRDNIISGVNDNMDDFKIPDFSTSDERRVGAAKDLVAALTDPAVHIIWIYTGGNPRDIIRSEQVITEFIYEVHRNSIHLHDAKSKLPSFTPKHMVGYCLAVPLLLYLSQRGLIKAIHGALGVDIHGISNDKDYRNILIPLYRNIFDANYCLNNITQLKPENDAALKMINNRAEINGVIFGGLLQIIHNALLIGSMVEAKTKIKSLITNQPIILFLELLAVGNEVEFGRKLLKVIMENNVQIKALAIGHMFEPETVENVKREVCAAANSVNIPVVSGLKVGHAGRQHPLLMCKANIKFNHSIAALSVSYDKDSHKKTMGSLQNVKPELMWSTQELANNNIQAAHSDNISDELCVIL